MEPKPETGKSRGRNGLCFSMIAMI